MDSKIFRVWALSVAALCSLSVAQQYPAYRLPCTPNATAATKAVLKYLYEIQGKSMLSGQMGEKWDVDRTFNYVKNKSGHYPAVYGIDMLFGRDRRSSAVAASIKWWKRGCLVTWSWHAVQPGKPEDGTTGWNDMHSGADPALVKQILTPGSAAQKEWFDRIDDVAGHIKTLQDSGVVLIWRPFHECNYDWFWWGGMADLPKLYRQMWDRYVNHHQLRNIIWNWNVNYEFRPSALPMSSYYPGHDVVDMTSIDIYIDYKHTWSKSQYDKVYQLGAGRPVAIGENGILPDPAALLSDSRNWVYWMTWNGFESKADAALLTKVYNQPVTLSLGEVKIPAWDQTAARSQPAHSRLSPASSSRTRLVVGGGAPGTGTSFLLSGSRGRTCSGLLLQRSSPSAAPE